MTPLERLWNGWRATYVQSLGTSEVPAGEGSIFTRILASGMSDEDADKDEPEKLSEEASQAQADAEFRDKEEELETSTKSESS